MRRLIAFGDSWTHGHGVEDDITWKEQALPNDFVFQWRQLNSWPRWLSDRFGMLYLNFGLAGLCNSRINQVIHAFLPYLRPDDLVIVMWSYPYRGSPNAWDEKRTLQEILQDTNQLLNGYNYFYFNSFFPTFSQEPWVKNEVDITRFVQVDGCAADMLREHERQHDVSVWEYQSRNVTDDRQNFQWGDYHPNVFGYQLMADWMYDGIINHACFQDGDKD